MLFRLQERRGGGDLRNHNKDKESKFHQVAGISRRGDITKNSIPKGGKRYMKNGEVGIITQPRRNLNHKGGDQ